MTQDSLYLRDDVYFEPLINSWYAWAHLVSPATASRHIANNHLRIMRSFVINSKLHIMASKEPSLVGGEFLNCSEDQIEDVKKLVSHIEENYQDLLALSESIKKLDELLSSHVNGESIEYLYEKVPGDLKGLVEIFLDMEHRPSYRVIEPLLYLSDFYKKSLQSVSFGLHSKVAQRPFSLSTPRIPDEHHMQVQVAFDDPMLDKVFRSRELPMREEDIHRLFAPGKKNGGLDYRDLFTDAKPPSSYSPVEEGIRLEYTGHAGFLVQSKDISILIDPLITARAGKDTDGVISFNDLPPKIDYICISHTHTDHFNLETLLQLRHKTELVLVPKNNGGSLADPSMRLILKNFGFKVREVEDLDEIVVPGGRIIGIPFLGEHGDLNIRSKTAWFIELCGKRLFFGADSSNPDNSLYLRLQNILKDIDVFSIGMECVGAPYTWIYGALHTKKVPKSIKDSRRLNGSDCKQALPMIVAANPKQVFIYALGLEPWYQYLMGINYDDDSTQIVESKKLISECEKIGIAAEKLFGHKRIELA